MSPIGNVAHCYSIWEKLTKNEFVLSTVKNGISIEFNDVPIATKFSHANNSLEKRKIIDSEIAQLLSKNVIKIVHSPFGNILSSVFTVAKRSGGDRMILNLKLLNRSVVYRHVKMEGLNDVINLMQPGLWMGSIDLKDAYYSIPVNGNFQKYFSFSWNGITYQYIALPNGFGPAVRIFTKLMKVPFTALRMRGHMSVVYLDDSFLAGITYSDCQENIEATRVLLQSLGFIVHTDKSVLKPTQKLTFLGFIFNSRDMTISLTKERVSVILQLCQNLIDSFRVTIRELARVIGTLVSAFPAVKFGQLHYRHLESLKIKSLQFNNWDFEAKILLDNASLADLNWWTSNECPFTKQIHSPPISLVLHSDASLLGWGGFDGQLEVGDQWSDDLSPMHINGLELTAAFLTLKSFCNFMENCHIHLKMDNTTAVTYLNKMGGMHSEVCNSIAVNMWKWAQERNIWLSAVHIPGKSNTVADKKSREILDNTEWMLHDEAFQEICKFFKFEPVIDLFASNSNTKCPIYYSWKSDPCASAINAFNMTWQDNFYAFPPFNQVGRTLLKLKEDRVCGIIVLPFWPSQPWFPLFLSLLCSDLLCFSPAPRLLIHECGSLHPLRGTLSLMVALVSGRESAYLLEQRKFSFPLCEKEPKSNTPLQFDDGKTIVWRGRKIPIHQRWVMY